MMPAGSKVKLQIAALIFALLAACTPAAQAVPNPTRAALVGVALGSTAILTAPETFTPTITLTPSPTELPVEVMLPERLYVRALANVRSCADRSCPPVGRLREGEHILVTGTIQGEAITPGNTLWYRIYQLGEPIFIYSDLVTDVPPMRTPTPPIPVNPLSDDCNRSDVFDWLLASQEVIPDLYAHDIETIQSARDRIVTTPYPQCAETARQYFLQAFDEAVLEVQADSRRDFDAASSHLDQVAALIDAYLDAVNGLLELPGTSSQSAPAGSDSSGTGERILCNDYTLSDATTQDACSGHGGIWELPTLAPSTGSGSAN